MLLVPDDNGARLLQAQCECWTFVTWCKLSVQSGILHVARLHSYSSLA